jgi:asparagine synthase (glutamine-hydrolysing)
LILCVLAPDFDGEPLEVSMSGIVAIFNLDGSPAEPDLLERMLATIAHRGPDGCGRYIDGPVALGHQMLHTTPESLSEGQPLSDSDARLCLVLDGRVDNRAELFAALKTEGAEPRSDTDAELVLRAYQCWGVDAPLRIIGDFAFVIWDAPRRQLFCARDPMGAKPFYYYRDERHFICASELHQLFADPAMPRKPNEGMVAEHLIDRHTCREETLFLHIMRLIPAHCLTITPAGISRRRYFDLDPAREIRYRTDPEYAEHFREIFREAVRCRLRTSTWSACSLSGGLDSASIVGTAMSLYRDHIVPPARFETYSLSFPAPADETRYARDVTEMWGLNANIYEPLCLDMTTCVEQVEFYRDIPEYPNRGTAAKFFQKQGCRVVLDGRGGDEWLTGSPYYYADLIRHLRIGALLRRMRSSARLAELNFGVFRPWRTVLNWGLAPMLPSAVYRAFNRAAGRENPPSWLNAEFFRRSNVMERVHGSDGDARFRSFAQRDIYAIFLNGHVTHAQEMEERTASWSGLEVRCPFYDRRVIEFSIALPEEQRRRDDWIKFILRNSMRGMIPESVRNRKDKADFADYFARPLRSQEVERLFGSLSVAGVGWVDQKRILELYRATLERCVRRETGIGRSLWTLWAVLGLELWFRLVFMEKTL